MILFLLHNLSFVKAEVVKMKDSIWYPAPLILLDGYFSHHTLVVEKSTHMLHIFKNNDGHPEYLKNYHIATGKSAGNKLTKGDFKTPEGIYHFTDFVGHDDLMKRLGESGKIYGIGSFVMNYPNPMDKRKGKTGGGIWLHSTNDETRIEKGLDSRGCVVTANNDLRDISKYIQLNKTSMVVVHELYYLKKNTWNKIRQELITLVNDWMDAWKEEDLKKYLSFYHQQEYYDNVRGNYWAFASHKKNVFLIPGSPDISINNMSIIQSSKYAVVTFKQGYKSKTIEDTGKKSLYLKKDNSYHWKIVNEIWNKIPIDSDSHAEFKPSMRFFTSSESESKESYIQ